MNSENNFDTNCSSSSFILAFNSEVKFIDNFTARDLDILLEYPKHYEKLLAEIPYLEIGREYAKMYYASDRYGFGMDKEKYDEFESKFYDKNYFIKIECGCDYQKEDNILENKILPYLSCTIKKVINPWRK